MRWQRVEETRAARVTYATTTLLIRCQTTNLFGGNLVCSPIGFKRIFDGRMIGVMSQCALSLEKPQANSAGK
jgi:hypothetical protein